VKLPLDVMRKWISVFGWCHWSHKDCWIHR